MNPKPTLHSTPKTPLETPPLQAATLKKNQSAAVRIRVSTLQILDEELPPLFKTHWQPLNPTPHCTRSITHNILEPCRAGLVVISAVRWDASRTNGAAAPEGNLHGSRLSESVTGRRISDSLEGAHMQSVTSPPLILLNAKSRIPQSLNEGKNVTKVDSLNFIFTCTSSHTVLTVSNTGNSPQFVALRHLSAIGARTDINDNTICNNPLCAQDHILYAEFGRH